MVAITVILAAVIGTFVLGLGDSLGDDQPTAQLNIENTNYTANTADIVHNGGDTIQGSNLNVTVNGGDDTASLSGSLGVGQSRELSFSTDISQGDRLRIIHTPSDSIILDRTL